ncbi:dTDP-4-dehydrorhamnose reductase [Andreprevotia chitinilytica]|uniref:dTDP-4-dehydrorhamnose reductase n=1 Tax=Andreprevotia chitinilytica TaxID=396808 RepID=UPI000551C8E9|nr:dTDP-4-dehydrorhamnose reductase [Andreprevotia chitinilytica]
MPTILIIGKNGQVGFELQRSLVVLGNVIAVDRSECDLVDPATIQALVARVQPDIIVNSAAYTAVDKAESEQLLAHAVNAIAPGVLGECAEQIGALLVHYSTDYVFDGGKDGRYTEDDATNPQSVYGKTKRDGELGVAKATPKHLIFRTSWVFGAHGGNFLKTVLRLAAELERLEIVADQWGAPTPASLIADATAQILGQYLRTTDRNNFPYGTYHLVAAEETTWHGYAQVVLNQAMEAGRALKAGPAQLVPISAAAYPRPAPRPANSRLATTKLEHTFGLVLPNWRIGVAHVLAQLTQ